LRRRRSENTRIASKVVGVAFDATWGKFSVIALAFRQTCSTLFQRVALLKANWMRAGSTSFALLIAATISVSAAETQLRRIYFLESLSPNQPAAMRTIEAFKQRLSEKTTERFEIFIDYMELVRLPSQRHIDQTAEYLAGKYAEAPPDLLIALGRAAIPFLAKNRNALAPNVPTIIANVPAREVTKTDHFDNLFFVATEYSFARTLELARQLQPKARDVAVIGGASDYDRQWLDDARRELQPYSDRYTIKYIEGLPYDEMLKQVSQLSKDSIAVMSYVFVDGSGRARVPPQVAASVATISPAPVYSPISSYLGVGIVGGYMDSWEQQGAATADLALKLLSSNNLATIPRQTIPTQMYRVDERPIKRWGLSTSRLPSDSDIQFHQFDLWEQYRWQIISIAIIVLAQAAVIGGLIIERRRRQAAELELRDRLLEVIHLNRTAVAGTLSASIAHELNQPLGAIQSYAEAAMLYLGADPPNVARAEQILSNILRDNDRAAQIISHLRALLKKKSEDELEEIDLSEVVHDTLQIVGPEALKKGIGLVADQEIGRFVVRGDRIHLQQVILNLAMNAIDAMQTCEPGTGKMSIKAALNGDSAVKVWVEDSGMGIPPDKLGKIFDAFYTTKKQGTGLGLSIARTIIETYGGRIWAENRLGGGAIFCFTVPLLKVVTT
jgi:signal transduction histidine kinase